MTNLRAGLPDLLVSADERTGAVRTLSNASGYLSEARGGDPERIAIDFVSAHADLFGLSADDLRDYEVTDLAYSEATGVSHLYLRQRHAGLPVYNGQLHVNVAADGRILSVNNQFVPGLERAVNSTRAAISAQEAVASLAEHLGVAELGAQASEPQLMLLPIRPGEVRLVWNFVADLVKTSRWLDVTVDAVDGRVWTRFDWVADVNDYRVYQRPVEAPTFVAPLPPADGRTLQTNPANATASPFGWHDTNGAAGNEFTRTRGNNAHAYTDTDANNVPDAGSDPECGASILCDFPLDLTQPPSAYRPGAVTNLFYWNNVIHDVAFLYGFDSPGGNFQVNTYGLGGVGNDDVQAEAQDGAGVNNANFATPPDGSRPRMQMFVWTAPTPDRDGDVDNGIIAHEYGHGISNRLVGGPANVGCLQNAEQPGEGLSDWWSLFYTFEPTNPDVRGIGTYALNQPTTGPGIRTQRYDKAPEPNTNTWTYASVMGSVIPHGVGEKWGQAYWYVTGRLEDAHGHNNNVYAFTGTAADAGNVRAMAYIIEGLKNAVCSPGFVDTRNGIIEATETLYGGVDTCLVWQAFADYGLGFSASQGSSSSINDQTPAFDIPPSCQGGGGNQYCATVSIPIPDNVPAGVSHTMNIPDSGPITDLDVSVTMQPDHTWIGDLIVTLTKGATSRIAMDRPGVPATAAGCSANLDSVTLDDEAAGGPIENPPGCSTTTTVINGTFTPNNTLSIFDGVELSGDWTITISDNAGADLGTLVEWCVIAEAGPTTEPDIVVDPASLSSTQAPDTQVVEQLDIENVGDANLDWDITEGSSLAAGRGRVFGPGIQEPIRSRGRWNAPAAEAMPQGRRTFSRSTAVVDPNAKVSGPIRPEVPAGTVTITHSASQSIVALNSVSCNAGGLHTNNSYLRRFDLADFGITDDFGVQQVEVGVEQAVGAGGSQPVEVRLYTWDPADPFTFANFTLIGSANASVADQSLSILAVPVTGTAPVGSTLVVELFTPNGQAAGHSFFVGSNAAGQTDASFIAAADCGITEPTDLAVIGFPNMHVVMNVSGIAGGGGGGCPTSLPWVSASPTSGTTAPGATSTVDVTFDSTGLNSGDVLTGLLCVESNDPDTPVVEVPLTLTVSGEPDIDVTPTSLSSTLGPDEQETQTLDIENVGDADLDWTLEEAAPTPLVSTPVDLNYPRSRYSSSAGQAPNQRPVSAPLGAAPQFDFGVTPAYSWNSQNGPYYTVFDLAVPAVLPNIAPFPGNGQFIGAGEIVNGLVYMVDVANGMWEVDPATGAILDTFTATAPAGGETWSGMALDPTSGTVYAGATNVTTSSLWTMDVTTGAATLVGPITNSPGLIALAVDGAGDLWGYDIVADVLLSIDKTTGAGTVVGPIGFDANFGQGMGWDPTTDTLLMAAFNGGAFQAELRSVDRATGNSTLVGVLGSTTPGGLNQLSWLGLEIAGGPCSSPSDLPWVSVDPTSGTTAPGATSTVDVTFDSTGLAAGTYEGLLCINSNDPDEAVVEVPVTLTVDSMPFLDGFETGDTSRWSFVLN